MNSADSACYVAKKQGGVHVHVYSAREEANARHSRRDPLAAEAAGRAARQQIRAVLPAHRACAQRGLERPGARGVRAHGERERRARRAAGGIHPGRGALPADAARGPLGGAGGAVSARARRHETAAGPQRRHQHLGPDARRLANFSSSWSNASITRERIPRTSASKSPRARWWRTSTMRGASSGCCTAWAASSRWIISAAGSPRSRRSRPCRWTT